ncbi:MAG: asparagine synthase (glutamine-hydrolyzing) [Acidobacteria bacterium]|nr:MAG: asparagine synthase (glutamine-hydrolyzing) [Acidobacteriota bacterium]
MCGITGFTTKNWSAPTERIREAAATLIHRGPDQQGIFQSNLFSMGATRLKIIDLESGNQPILTEDGDTGIVFNGEIYNHLELRAELEKLGHRFASHSDTETVLRAFLQWDKDCFSRMRGMFAVALWTKSAKRIVLARDRMGIKPLYIARIAEDLFFGSELKALFVHPEIDRRLSLRGLDCYLALNYIPCPWTLVDGIEKLPPGDWLEWTDGTISTDSYWRLPFGVSENVTLESAKEELDSLLQDAVQEHLISDVPLGVWLSGGIDSSTILHYAAKASSSRLKTFSISFRGRSFDETEYVHRAAKQYGTDHQELDLTPEEDLRGAIEEFAYFSDEPGADAGALPVWFLSKLCKTKTTVALSGEGADELFGGYLTYRANRLAARARLLPRTISELALAGFQYWPVSDEKISFEYKVKRFLEGSLMPPARAHVYWNGTFSDAEKSALLKQGLPDSLNRILAELDGLPPTPDDLAPYLWFDQKYFLADDILTKSDRMSMAHSVEVRPPFLDHRLVEFAAKLPASFKIRGTQQKFILKELMKDKLPTEILKRKKIGFDIPAHEWLRGPLRSLLIDALHYGAAECGEIFRTDVIDTYLRLHLERKANVGYHLWGLLILFLWMKKWRIQAASSATPKILLQARAGAST